MKEQFSRQLKQLGFIEKEFDLYLVESIGTGVFNDACFNLMEDVAKSCFSTNKFNVQNIRDQIATHINIYKQYTISQKKGTEGRLIFTVCLPFIFGLKF